MIAEAIKRELLPQEVIEYNGTVPQGEHVDRLAKVNTAGGSGVLLLTSATGDTGLNVTGASHIIMTERSWSPGQEEQAVGRCSRLSGFWRRDYGDNHVLH